MAIKCLPTRITTNFVLCGLVLLIISTCKASLSRADKVRYDKAKDVLKQFPCGPPQPRSIMVDKLLADVLDTSETVSPHVTVLHRCDAGTGCCPKKSNVCKVAEKTELELDFLVIDSIRHRAPELRRFRVHNHTRCECQSAMDNIK